MSKKIINVSGRRKMAVARATVRSGSGKIRVNGVPLQLYSPVYLRMRIDEAVILAQKEVKSVDIDVRVTGGGPAGQAEAVRLAIGRGLVAYTNSDELKNKFIAYDRHLFVADIRQKEVSKPNCRGKARAKRQKSYR